MRVAVLLHPNVAHVLFFFFFNLQGQLLGTEMNCIIIERKRKKKKVLHFIYGTNRDATELSEID